KTQEKVRLIMDTMYNNTTDGISGNDDCGQMSAWFIFSSLGFYPVCPGSNQYVIGSPCIEKAEVSLENGKTFNVQVHNYSPKNRYIQSVKLNGKEHQKTYINHNDIITGATIEYIMGKNPNKLWGKEKSTRPYSLSE
ncbi:MAG: glycoside hydrolase family 92 protein, partial [bacterium]